MFEPLEGDRDFGELCGSHQGCQVPFRPPIPNVGAVQGVTESSCPYSEKPVPRGRNEQGKGKSRQSSIHACSSSGSGTGNPPAGRADAVTTSYCLLSPLHVGGQSRGRGGKNASKENEASLVVFTEKEEGGICILQTEDAVTQGGECTWTPAVLRGAR